MSVGTSAMFQKGNRRNFVVQNTVDTESALEWESIVICLAKLVKETRVCAPDQSFSGLAHRLHCLLGKSHNGMSHTQVMTLVI